MGAIASQITSLTNVYSTVYSGADQRKQQSSASLAFVRGIHRWPVHSPHKGPVTRKMFPFDDVIMYRATNYTASFQAQGKTNASPTTNPTLTSMSFYTLAKWTRYIYQSCIISFGKHLILDHTFEMRSGLWQCISCNIWLGYHRQAQKLSLTKKLTQTVCFAITEYLLMT